MTTSKPTVLIGFAQAFAAVEAAWSLQGAGMRVVAFARRGTRSALRRVPGVLVYEITPPEVSVTGCLADLDRVMRSLSPDAVLPLDDASLWLTSRLDLGAATFVGPSPAGAALALDKRAQIEAARAAGLAVPPTECMAELGPPRSLPWPVVVKPADAVAQVGDRLVRLRGAICADEGEFDEVSMRLGEGRFLAQPFLTGIGEGVFGYVDDVGPTTLSAHRRVRMLNPHGSASSACISIDVPRDLVEPIEHLLSSVSWTGLFMVEFLRDSDGIPWFMELNGRAWGSLALARRRGFEYPAWAAQFALGRERTPAPPLHPQPILARHLGRELAHVLFVLRGPQSHAITTWPGRRATVIDLLRVGRNDRLYNWNPRQPRVLVSDTWGTFTELVGGRRRG